MAFLGLDAMAAQRQRRFGIGRWDSSFWRRLLDRVWPARLQMSGNDGGPIAFADPVRNARIRESAPG
jgi:hypothetical protein